MDTIRSTITENIGLGLGNKLAQDEHKFTIEQVPSQADKVAVITGGSAGIGYACLHTLLKQGARKVYVISDTKYIAQEAEKALLADFDDGVLARMHWLQCDLADLAGVRDTAERIKAEAERVDVLINNAGRGIMTAQLTDDGIDRHMAITHFGHVTLTSHLLPLLKQTAGQGNVVRVVNQASNLHEAAPSEVKFESLEELNKDYGAQPQYGRSKLAAILYARYLARHVTPQHPNLLFNATHPGVVSTKMSKEDIHEPYPVAGYAMSVGLEPFKKDAFEGALSTLFAATATKESGQYICPPATPEPGSKQSQDEALGEQLMKLTREIIASKTKSESVDKGCPVDDVVLY